MNTPLSFQPVRRLVLLLASIVCLSGINATFGAISFDSAASTSAISAASVTWSHTIGSGSNQVLVVGICTEDTTSTDLNVSSITYNGAAMTPVANSAAIAGTTTLDKSQLFYLLSPSSGTHSIVVSFAVTGSGVVNGICAGSISLNDVAQTAPTNAAINTTTGNTTISASIPVSTDGSWLVDAVCNGASSLGNFTPGASQTRQWFLTQTKSSGAGSTASVATSGTASASWTATSSGQLALSVAAFAPASAPGATAPTITSQPTNQTAVAGSTATFSVGASGTAPLSYQWYKDSTAMTTATTSTLTLTNVQAADAASYNVVVSNSAGSVPSNSATLTVTAPIAPSITAQPQNQTVNAGTSATFSVSATGSAPLSYQWFKSSQSMASATNSTLTLTNVQSPDAASYNVVVTNSVNSATSNAATLTVTPTLPSITTQPQSQTVTAGQSATFSVTAGGTLPLSYQWKLGGSIISGGTDSSYAIANVQAANAGSYTVTVTNSVGSVTSNSAILSVNSGGTGSFSQYNLTGFATVSPGTTGGGIIAETNAAYVKVYTPLDFANAIKSSNKTAGAVKVIEIMNDLDLGWNEVGSSVQNLASTPFRQHNAVQLHPRLLVTGVSLIDMSAKGGGLTIFSANGATIRHATFNVKATSNIIIRNLKFDEMWEWDEASKGNYDKNDWDFIDLSNGGNATNVWIDHCTFTKTYDGIVDMKAGTQYVTMSWCKYVGDDGATNSNSFVRQQINALEANASSYTFYNFLRTNGYSVEDIVAIIQAHDKTHLMGSNDLDSGNATLSATFHHQWFNGVWDRCVPRLRAGNVHDYNIYVDDTNVLTAKRLRDTRAAAMSTANQNTLNNTYSFNPPINGSISTENGAVLVEKSVYIDCLWPLRNNQTDPTNPVYTGKIKALDTIYTFHNTDGTVTNVRGDSTDTNSPLGPFQAPIIAFSWNGFTSLPYAYTPDDPATLLSQVQAGAGAGVLAWSKDNWLKTSYQDPPGITTQPASQTAGVGSSVSFTVVANGTAPLSYQWQKNGVAITAGTASTLTLNNVQNADASNYRVVVSNVVSSLTSGTATLTVIPSFVSWQQDNFTTLELSNPAISGPTVILGNDGITNLEKYALGLSARGTVAASSLPSIKLDNTNAPVFTYNRLASATDIGYHVQVSNDLVAWSETNVTQQRVATGTIETWEARYSAALPGRLYFRLLMQR